ncbi:hypothetical protein [Clostridium taeniosporum]|uniref:SH3 domain-containing protein n=1 Tax=Clostridium taeniosporum TaxID=394958 RepID=A0A1D7XN47_9CLOT|nr:hypothetical protein [Clostridium taeniosporum]AOR24697.1 hypothetical protein BGI42_13525 [Clostridium taeniosporum]
MKILLFLLFIIVASGSLLFLIYNYENRISSVKKQLIASQEQFFKLKSKYNQLNTLKHNPSIMFLDLTEHAGLLTKDSIVYLSPNELAPALQTLDISMEVYILDKALCNKTVWYYVSLPIDTNINSRGWVKEDCFSSFLDKSSYTDIIKC